MGDAPTVNTQNHAQDSASNSGCLTLFGLVFALPGVIVGVSTLRKFAAGSADVKQLVLGFTTALLFAGAGVGLIVWGRVSTRLAAKDRETKARNPDKPWLWRDDWAAGFARAEWKSAANLMALMGTVFLLFSVPMFIAIGAAQLREHPLQTALVLLFPLAGAYLVIQSALAHLRFCKFREMRLRLPTIPCPLGVKLQGRLEIEQALPPGAMVRLKLSCVRSYVSRSGSDRTTWEKILWQDRRDVPSSTDGQSSFLPVEFMLPYDAQETDARNPDDEILWRLTAASPLPGLDFNATFRVPIFKMDAGDAALTAEALDTRAESRLRGARPADSSIVTSAAPDGGLRFYMGPARNKSTAAALTVFGAIFLGAGLFFGFVSSRAFTWFIGIIPLTLSGGIGLLLLAISCDLWFGTITVEVINRELHIRSGHLGIARSRVIDASAIQDFVLKSNLQQGDHIWYDVQLKLTNGRSVTAGSGLEKQEAEWFRAELKKDLGWRG